MKRFTFGSMAVISFLLVILVCGIQHQNQRIARGDLVVVNIHDAASHLSRGPMYVDKLTREIVDKTLVYPIVILREENGQVVSHREGVAIRALFSVSVPATSNEIALYRKYFPAAFESNRTAT